MAALRPAALALLLAALLAPAWPAVLAGSERGGSGGVWASSVPDRMLVTVWSVELGEGLLRAEPVYTPGGHLVLFVENWSGGYNAILSLDPETGEIIGRRVVEETIDPWQVQVGVDRDGGYVAFIERRQDRVMVLSLPELSYKVNAKPSEGELEALLYLGNGLAVAAYNQDLVTRVVALEGSETLWVEELAGDYVLDSCGADGRLFLALASEASDTESWVAIVEAGIDGVRVLANETSEGRVYWYAGGSGAGFSPDCSLLAVALEQDAGTLLRVFEVYGDGSWEHFIKGFLAASEAPLTWSTDGSYLALPLAEERYDYRATRVLFMPRSLLTGGTGEPVEYTIPPDEGTYISDIYAVYNTSMGPLAVLRHASRFLRVHVLALVPVGWGDPIVKTGVPAYGYSPYSGTVYLAYLDSPEGVPVFMAYRPGAGGLERAAAYPALLAVWPDYVVPLPSEEGDRLVFAGHTAGSDERVIVVAMMDWRDVVRVYEGDSLVVTMYPMSDWWGYNETLEASGPGYSVSVSVSVKLRKGAGYWYVILDNGTAALEAGSYGAVAIVDVTVTGARGVQALDLTIIDQSRGSVLARLVEGVGYLVHEYRPNAKRLTINYFDLEEGRAHARLLMLLPRLDPDAISPGDRPLDFELTVKPADMPGGGTTAATTAAATTSPQAASPAGGEAGEGGGTATGYTEAQTETAGAGGARAAAAIVLVVAAVLAAAVLIRR